MRFINNCLQSDITNTMLSSGTLADLLNYLAEIYTKQYDNFMSQVAKLGEDVQLSTTVGIGTIKGFLSFEKFRSALANGDATMEFSEDDGTLTEVSVGEARDLIMTAKEDAASVASSFHALADSVENGKELTEDIIDRYWQQLTGGSTFSFSGIKGTIDNLILSTTNTVLQKVEGILNMFTPSEDLTSITTQLNIGEYSYGTPWSAWTIDVPWSLQHPFQSFHQWNEYSFKTMLNVSIAIVTGVFNLFKTAFTWLGNKYERLIAGDRYTRISNKNSICDTAGFPICLYGSSLNGNYGSYMKHLFNDEHGAIQINVPGGILIWYGYDDSAGWYRYYVRFIPENQSNLIPASSYDFNLDAPTYWYWDKDDDYEDARLTTSYDHSILELSGYAAEAVGLVNPYNKTEPSFLKMDQQSDINQYCSSWRPSFWLFCEFLTQYDQNHWSGEDSVCNPHNSQTASIWESIEYFFPNNHTFIKGAYAPGANLVKYTASNTTAYISTPSQGGDSRYSMVTGGLNELLDDAAVKYVDGIVDENYYTWPIQKVIYRAPAYGIHVSTNADFSNQLESIFTHAKRIAIIAAVATVSIVALKKLRFLATKAQIETDLMIFSEGWTGSTEQIKAYMKLRRKSNTLAFFSGAFLSSLLGGDSSVSPYDDKELKKIIRGY